MRQFRQKRKNQQGLSLIELMIALVIGLLLMAAILQMFVGSRVTYSMQNELAKMQENARFAIDFISKDLRMAGYMGCKTYGEIANTLRLDTDSAPYSQYDISQPISIENNYDSDVGTTVYLSTDASPVAGTDLISVKFADTGGSCTVDGDHNVDSAVIPCSGHDFKTGDILLISDCKHTAIFQHIGNNAVKVVHNTGNSTSPGNCTSGLGYPVACKPLSNEYKFLEGVATVQKLNNYTYYIELNKFGENALYRSSISVSSGTASPGRQELVEGVEDMQIQLGFDTDGDGSADCYSDTATGCRVSMDEVVAVRVSLLMRSIENNIVSDSQTYLYNGEKITTEDGYFRKGFTATITLRNLVIR